MLNGMGAIMKRRADLTSYFDLAMRSRVKQNLKREQACLGCHRASNLWQETLRYNYGVKLANANTQKLFRRKSRVSRQRKPGGGGSCKETFQPRLKMKE
jgi:hypothetical protein